MQHTLLIVLEAGPTSAKVLKYVRGAVVDSSPANLRLVLFAAVPGLPPWIEASESWAAATARATFTAGTDQQTAQLLENARAYFVNQGIPAAAIQEEIVEESPRLIEDLIAIAHRHACDTIVMARHHKSMVSEFFAGDPEEKLLRHPTGFTVWLVE